MIIILVICGILFALYHLFPLIQVVGDSMFPTYHNSEIILGTKLYIRSQLKEGDVIVYKSPVDGKIVIKRISIVQNMKGVIYFYCLGDNSECSYDSRNYGYVSSYNLVCKVINQRRNKNVCS